MTLAERVVRAISQFVHRLRIGDVGANADHVASGSTARHRAVQKLLLDVGNHDLGPLGHELLDERAADATGTARHDGDLALQVLHRIPLFVLDRLPFRPPILVAGSEIAQGGTMNRYIVISSDGHAGPPAEIYREYLDPEFRERFDEHQKKMSELRGPPSVRDRPSSRSGRRRPAATAV